METPLTPALPLMSLFHSATFSKGAFGSRMQWVTWHWGSVAHLGGTYRYSARTLSYGPTYDMPRSLGEAIGLSS